MPTTAIKPPAAIQPGDLVFVYGTLKRGYGNNRVLGKSEFISTATSVDKLAMIGKGMPFPYIINMGEPAHDGHNLVGEVWRVDNAQTSISLDRLEGFPHHYGRKQRQFLTAGGEQVTAWFYHSAADGRFVAGGGHDLIREWNGRAT